ncbi:hypothetical protein Trihar35433_1019 [Trichoderma harzianum]|nr:hypothetical protein Trihar35433_1019 [Trichoderma harzianum]
MNGDNAFRPDTASTLVVTFDAAAEGSVSVVVFELGDEHLGGIRLPGTQDKEIFCNSQNVERKLCKESQIGEFLISDHAKAKAKHPMITRSIDLKKPIAIVYPIQGPGYFCAATYSHSAKSYSDPSMATLGIISIAQVGFRWGSLQLGESKAASVLQILWYGLELTQNSVVMFMIHKLVAGSEASPPDSIRSKVVRRILPYVYLAVFSVVFSFASLADFTVTAESIRPAIVTIFLGIYLFVGAATAAFMLARRHTTTHEHQRGSSTEDKLIRKPLSFVLAVLCIPIIAIAGYNIWAILKVGGDGTKFAHMFWHSRFGTIDMPYEPLFLILVMALLGLNTYQAQRHDEMTDMKSMGTEGLMSYKPVSMDSNSLHSIAFSLAWQCVISALLDFQLSIVSFHDVFAGVPIVRTYRVFSGPVKNFVEVTTGVLVIYSRSKALHNLAPFKVDNADIRLTDERLADLIQAVI